MATNGKDTLMGGVGNDTLRGQLGDDTYIYHLGQGTDTIIDTGGLDTLVLGDPNGLFAGTFNVARSGNNLVFDFGTAGKVVLQQQFASDGTAPASRIEYFRFEDEPDRTMALANGLKGTDKNDFIVGTSAAEKLSGSLGDDWLWGGAGKDSLYGGDGDDELHGGTGDDLLSGGAGEDLLEGGAGNDSLFGGTGHDDVSYRDQGAGIVFNFSGAAIPVGNRTIASGQVFEKATSTVDTLVSIESVEGTNYADVVVFGQPVQGNLSVYLGQGNDTVKGGGPVNVGYWDDPAGVIINLGDKALTAKLGDASYTVAAHTARDGWGGTDTFQFGSALQLWVQGSEHDDYIHGRDDTDNDTIWEWFSTEQGNDTLDGGTGIDTLSYESWDPTELGVVVNLSKSAITGAGVTLQAGTARDNWGQTDTLLNIENIQGSVLADYIVGSDLNNNFQGGAGRDTLLGGGGNDYLMGNDGNDLLIGGAGADHMEGNAGKDTFKFLKLSDFGSTTGFDMITGFVRGEDKIDLSAIDANTAKAGDQAFTFVAGTPTQYVPGQVWSVGGAVFINTDTDAAPEYQFYVNTVGRTALSLSDFIL